MTVSRLEDVPEAFARAHEAASRAALYPPGSAPPNTCRYCGRYLHLPPDARLDGHARCYVTDQFQAELLALWWGTPGLTKDRIARACGTSHTAVHRWTRRAQRLQLSVTERGDQERRRHDATPPG